MPAGRLDDLGALDEYVRSAGGSATSLAAIPNDDVGTAEDALRAIETNLMSWTVGVHRRGRVAAAREVREWVTQTYGDPAAQVIGSAPVQWRCYQPAYCCPMSRFTSFRTLDIRFPPPPDARRLGRDEPPSRLLGGLLVLGTDAADGLEGHGYRLHHRAGERRPAGGHTPPSSHGSSP
jgi:hypothetical protein